MPEPIQHAVKYSAVFRQRIDDKRRTSVPAKWRSGEEKEVFFLVVWPMHRAGVHLRVFSPEKMAQLWQYLDSMPNTDARKSNLKRTIGNSSTDVTVDSAGRIPIPEDMAQEAALTSEAVFAGSGDSFEIWNPARYAECKTLDKTDAAAAFQLLEGI